MSSALACVHAMIANINAHAVDAIVEGLTRDSVLVDPRGSAVAGREALRAAWRVYFEIFPDYRLEIEHSGPWCDAVICTGTASAHFRGRAERAWSIPVAIRADVHERRIARWQVFADMHLPLVSMG